jgi:hypothetical protein
MLVHSIAHTTGGKLGCLQKLIPLDRKSTDAILFLARPLGIHAQLMPEIVHSRSFACIPLHQR